jgi:monofunctional glycosyltransferase
MARRSSPAIPRYKRSSRRSLPARIVLFLFKLILALLLLSVLWVVAYRFINPPITATMVSDMVAGRGATREWMGLDRIDRDMVRASIAAEDSKFCQHSGFDFEAIEDAMQRNASGGRIRGGSTVSQQTAKNVFLWQGGGYVRKGIEAWFTFLIEQIWGKRRIMEVYLNVAETGIGTYGVNAGAERYYGHDASALTRQEAARIAAVLPLPKERGAIAPQGFTRRYGNTIAARIGVVGREGLDACVYRGTDAPADRAPPPTRRPVTVPGEEYESERPLPPIEEVVRDLPEQAPAGDLEQEPSPFAEEPLSAEPATETPPEPLPGENETSVAPELNAA